MMTTGFQLLISKASLPSRGGRKKKTKDGQQPGAKFQLGTTEAAAHEESLWLLQKAKGEELAWPSN